MESQLTELGNFLLGSAKVSLNKIHQQLVSKSLKQTPTVFVLIWRKQTPIIFVLIWWEQTPVTFVLVWLEQTPMIFVLI